MPNTQHEAPSVADFSTTSEVVSQLNKSIQMYTRIDPKLIYFASNSLFAKEYETKFPILYPLMNLMQLGISNYYDVSGSLNVSMN